MTFSDFGNDPQKRDVAILHALSAGQFSFGRFQPALDLLELALELDPDNADSYVMLSRTYYAMGQIEPALDWIDLAVEKAPNGLSSRDQVFERRIRLLADLEESRVILN